MRLDELAKRIGAKIIANTKPANVEIKRFYAGNKISDLLTRAFGNTLVVSSLINPHIFRVAELLDLPAICTLDGFVPQQEILNTAMEHGTILMVSPVGMLETLERLTRCLGRDAIVTNEDRAIPNRGR